MDALSVWVSTTTPFFLISKVAVLTPVGVLLVDNLALAVKVLPSKILHFSKISILPSSETFILSSMCALELSRGNRVESRS